MFTNLTAAQGKTIKSNTNSRVWVLTVCGWIVHYTGLILESYRRHFILYPGNQINSTLTLFKLQKYVTMNVWLHWMTFKEDWQLMQQFCCSNTLAGSNFFCPMTLPFSCWLTHRGPSLCSGITEISMVTTVFSESMTLSLADLKETLDTYFDPPSADLFWTLRDEQ